MQGVTYRVQLIVPSEKVEYTRSKAAADATAVEPVRTRELRYFDDDLLRGGRVPARRPSGRRAGRRPRDHPRGPLDDVRLPAADGRDRPLRRDRDRAGAAREHRRASRPRRRRVRRALRLRPLHRDGAQQPLRLRRRAHVRAAADGRVLADPARLLRLRRHAHRAGPRGLGHPGDEQQHHALHRHDGRLGPERRSRSTVSTGSSRATSSSRTIRTGRGRTSTTSSSASRSSTRARSSPSST